MSEFTAGMEQLAKPHLEPITMNEGIVSTKRHPIDNVGILPTKFGFSLINGSDEVFCEDYDFRTHPNPTGHGSEVCMVTYVDKDGIKVWDNGTERASYVIDHYFSSPQIIRLGDGNVEGGTYFVLDRRTINKPGEVDRLFRMKDDDLSKITARRGVHVSEEELDKSSIGLEGIIRIGEIKRIGEHVLVAGETENDKTKLFVIDKEGKTVLSKQVGYQVDRIVTNQKDDQENKFIIVTKNGKILMTELVKEDKGLNLEYSNNLQTQNIDHVTNLRNLIDVSIFGDEVMVAVRGTARGERNQNLINIISGDGTFKEIDQEQKEEITGAAYLGGYPYKLFRKDNCLNASLVTS